MSRSRRSSDRQYKSKPNTPIALSSIKYDSTCISLELPYSLACSNCGPALDPLTITRKRSHKKERHKSERRRCQQYWSSSWTEGKDATEGNVLKYQLTRRYLQIDSDITNDYYEAYNAKKINTNVYNPTEKNLNQTFRLYLLLQ